jgi:murein DD-endopeptidase MepM/ murein hydrolase activator NlpD
VVKYKYVAHVLVVSLLLISAIVPVVSVTPVERANAAPVATPIVEERLLPNTYTAPAVDRGNGIALRTGPLPTPVALDPSATPLAPYVAPTPSPVPTVAPVVSTQPLPPPPVIRTGWPVAGSVSQYYSSGHPAIDVVAPCNAAAVAIMDGEVTASGWRDNGGGNVVSVSTSLGIMEYNHLNSTAVVAGDTVIAGQVVGYVGATGWATGCHLHFAILQNGIWINPLSLL